MREFDFDATMRYGLPVRAIATVEVHREKPADGRRHCDLCGVVLSRETLDGQAADLVRPFKIRGKAVAGGVATFYIGDRRLAVKVAPGDSGLKVEAAINTAIEALPCVAAMLATAAAPFERGEDFCYLCANGQAVTFRAVIS